MFSFSFIYEHAIYECIYMYTCILLCIYVYLFMYTCVYSHACPQLHNMDINVCRSIISIPRWCVSNTHLHPPPTSWVLTLPPPLFIYFVYNDFGRCLLLLPSFLHVELERNIMPSVWIYTFKIWKFIVYPWPLKLLVVHRRLTKVSIFTVFCGSLRWTVSFHPRSKGWVSLSPSKYSLISRC